LKLGETAHLADEHRAPKEGHLRQLAHRALGIFLRRELDDAAGLLVMLVKRKKGEAHPQPLETPVGVTSTSAKSTSPANQSQKKTSNQYPLDDSANSQKHEKMHIRSLSSTASRPQLPFHSRSSTTPDHEKQKLLHQRPDATRPSTSEPNERRSHAHIFSASLPPRSGQTKTQTPKEN
jgi:hypothetical protein